MNYDFDKPYSNRVNQIIDWLKLPKSKRPHFLTLYFEDADTYGHKYGPDSPEINNAISRLDSTIGWLYFGLAKINLKDSVNVILVSDHGMTNVSPEKIINIENILEGYKCVIQENGPFMLIQPQKDQIDEVYEVLKRMKIIIKLIRKKIFRHIFIIPKML